MEIKNTKDSAYAHRLVALQKSGWKRSLRPFNPYRVHLRRICKGFVLEVGCGIGRVLDFLGGRAVGVDHNEEAVRICKQRGFNAFFTGDFFEERDRFVDTFDTLLTSHVLEHMDTENGVGLLRSYLPFMKNVSVLVLITPQERGFSSDESHVTFVDFARQNELLQSVGFRRVSHYSFPFPRCVGPTFIYNEFVSIGVRECTTPQ